VKKIVILSFVIIITTAFVVQTTTDRSIAQAEQQQGIYIFMLSKPAAAYDYQGSIKKTLAWTGQPAEMLNSMIKKCKKDFPTANGIIFTSIDMGKADCIKFKE